MDTRKGTPPKTSKAKSAYKVGNKAHHTYPAMAANPNVTSGNFSKAPSGRASVNLPSCSTQYAKPTYPNRKSWPTGNTPQKGGSGDGGFRGRRK